jgi:hypothetical protein
MTTRVGDAGAVVPNATLADAATTRTAMARISARKRFASPNGL